MTCRRTDGVGLAIAALTALAAVGTAHAQQALFELVPVRASGVEGVDWQPGPGPNEITLTFNSSFVELDLMVSGWGTEAGGMTAYAATLDCASFDSGEFGRVQPVCNTYPDFCAHIDASRPDYVCRYADCTTDCVFESYCPDGLPGRIRCWSEVIAGSLPDNGEVYYAATFAVHRSFDARGQFTIDLDPALDATMVRLADGSTVMPNVVPGLITLPKGRMTLVPVRASGVEGVDWWNYPSPGWPGYNFILASGGQSIEFDVMAFEWGDVALTGYESTFSCENYSSGILSPILVNCQDALPGEFCQGVDLDRADHIFAGSDRTGSCDVETSCPDGSPGLIHCEGATSTGGAQDDGELHYIATVAADVAPDVTASFDVALDRLASRIELADGSSWSPDVYLGRVWMRRGLLELVPVRASGVEGVDWQLGPAPNEITLVRGGQDVEVEMLISGWGCGLLGTYQGTLDCLGFESGSAGSLQPILQLCESGTAGDFCQGVDRTRPDYVFYASTDIPSCRVDVPCADGSPGRISCGSTVLFGYMGDDGGTYYGATFAASVSEDARGTFTFGLDSNPDRTFMVCGGFDAIYPETIPALITVPTGRCCRAEGAPLGCVDGVTAPECEGRGGTWTAGAACSGIDETGDFATGGPDGLDDACPVCTQNSHCDDGLACTSGVCVAESCVFTDLCDDTNACTSDVCTAGGCAFTVTTPAGLCCNPATGDLIEIDDGEECTADICDDATGTVTHGWICQPVPAVSTWGLVSLALALLVAGKLVLRRRERSTNF